MSREKNKYANAINIFFNGVGMYFKHLDTFLKYLAFPVLGQIVGIIVIFSITYFYTVNIANLTSQFLVLDNVLTAFSILLLFTLPAFFIFCKALYDYLIAMAALNSMANNLSAKGKNKVLDTKVHSELIRRRAFYYIILLFVLSFVYLIGILPVFWVLLVAFFVYSSLSLQVFTMEENSGPINAIKRSFVLVKNNFWATTMLLLLLFGLTYVLLPNVISWSLDKISFVYYAAEPVEKFVSLLPLSEVNMFFKNYHIPYELDSYELARQFVLSLVAFAVISFTLPIRSCVCTLWYKHLDDEKIEENRKATKLDGRVELKKIVKKSTRKTKEE